MRPLAPAGPMPDEVLAPVPDTDDMQADLVDAYVDADDPFEEDFDAEGGRLLKGPTC